MSNKIQFKRGLRANLPTLDIGEPAFTTNDKAIHIGTDAGNIELAKKSDIPTSLPANGGNAATATKLQTARQINGVAFDGSANITISATDNTKAPINHASGNTTYGIGTRSNYGHVAVIDDLNGGYGEAHVLHANQGRTLDINKADKFLTLIRTISLPMTTNDTILSFSEAGITGYDEILFVITGNLSFTVGNSSNQSISIDLRNRGNTNRINLLNCGKYSGNYSANVNVQSSTQAIVRQSFNESALAMSPSLMFGPDYNILLDGSNILISWSSNTTINSSSLTLKIYGRKFI